MLRDLDEAMLGIPAHQAAKTGEPSSCVRPSVTDMPARLHADPPSGRRTSTTTARQRGPKERRKGGFGGAASNRGAGTWVRPCLRFASTTACARRSYTFVLLGTSHAPMSEPFASAQDVCQPLAGSSRRLVPSMPSRRARPSTRSPTFQPQARTLARVPGRLREDLIATAGAHHPHLVRVSAKAIARARCPQEIASELFWRP